MDLIAFSGYDTDVKYAVRELENRTERLTYSRSITGYIKEATMRRFGLSPSHHLKLTDPENTYMELGFQTPKDCYDETENRGRYLDRYFWIRKWLDDLEEEAMMLPDDALVLFDRVLHVDDLEYLVSNFGHNSTVVELGKLNMDEATSWLVGSCARKGIRFIPAANPAALIRELSALEFLKVT